MPGAVGSLRIRPFSAVPALPFLASLSHGIKTWPGFVLRPQGSRFFPRRILTQPLMQIGGWG